VMAQPVKRRAIRLTPRSASNFSPVLTITCGVL
jgi:hypothetical protein